MSVTAQRILKCVSVSCYYVVLLTDERVPRHAQTRNHASRKTAIRESAKIARNMGWAVSRQILNFQGENK